MKHKETYTPGPWLALMRKDKPSGLTGDNGVERWTFGQDANAESPGRYPPGFIVQLPMWGDRRALDRGGD